MWYAILYIRKIVHIVILKSLNDGTTNLQGRHSFFWEKKWQCQFSFRLIKGLWTTAKTFIDSNSISINWLEAISFFLMHLKNKFWGILFPVLSLVLCYENSFARSLQIIYIYISFPTKCIYLLFCIYIDLSILEPKINLLLRSTKTALL